MTNYSIFNCNCGLTDEEVMDDISSIARLTGFESQAELQRLHLNIFHEEDDTDFWETEHKTPKQLAVEAKDYIRMIQRCAICPPNKGENANRKAKHGNQKKTKVNKKQGAAFKKINYNEAELMNDYIDKTKKAGKRKS